MSSRKIINFPHITPLSVAHMPRKSSSQAANLDYRLIFSSTMLPVVGSIRTFSNSIVPQIVRTNRLGLNGQNQVRHHFNP